ncbi:MAG: M48 family metalloprotease [Thermoanaerobacteraceae bacterium]|nr:M48 family metalloprotease [Thermoanaerobacteraceae bacterium]
MINYIIIICITILINIAIIIFINKKILSMYNNKNLSIEYVLDKFIIMQEYYKWLVMIISLFVLAFAIGKIMHYINIPKSMILSIIVVWGLMFFLAILNQIISHNTYKKLRNLQLSYWDDLKRVISYLLIIFIPYFIIAFCRINLIDKYKIEGLLQYVIFVTLILLINILYPHIIRFLIKAKELRETELKKILIEFLSKYDIYGVKIYEWPSIKTKEANALVAGIGGRYLFITDYLIKNLSVDELKAVIVHEIGHWKKRHLLKRILLIISMYYLFLYPTGNILDYLEVYRHINIPIPIGITVFFLVFWLCIYLSLIIIRFQEYSADEYVIESGIDVNTYISALLKLAKLNDNMVKLSKLREKFQDHPSVDNRIKHLLNVSDKIRNKLANFE